MGSIGYAEIIIRDRLSGAYVGSGSVTSECCLFPPAIALASRFLDFWSDLQAQHMALHGDNLAFDVKRLARVHRLCYGSQEILLFGPGESNTLVRGGLTQRVLCLACIQILDARDESSPLFGTHAEKYALSGTHAAGFISVSPHRLGMLLPKDSWIIEREEFR